MRSQRFFNDNQAKFMKSSQAFLMLIPAIWGLYDASKGDSDNALLKLMWFMLMLGSYINGYLLADSNPARNVSCNLQHFPTRCDLPHFPANAKFSRNAMDEFLENSPDNQRMKEEYKNELVRNKIKENEPGFQEEGREDSQQLRI